MSPGVTRVSLALLLLLLAGSITCQILDTPLWSFNGTRLMPSFLLSRGHKVFEKPGVGPFYSTIYGPLTYIVYIPATWLRTPNASVLAGSIITISMCLAGMAALHFGNRKPGPYKLAPLLGFVTAAYLVCNLETLRYSCFAIHADGPGLAFGAAACALAMRRGPSRLTALVGSAVFAVMSALCKQPLALLGAGLFVYLAVADGWRVARYYLAALCGATLVLLGSCLLVFGLQESYYNMLWIPGHHPFFITGLRGVVQPLRGFIRMGLPVLLIPLSALAIALGSGWRPTRQWFRDNEWTALFVVGLALLPSSLAGTAKLGGDINSYSFSMFYLANGVTCMLSRISGGFGLEKVRQVSSSILISLMLLLAFTELPVSLIERIHRLDSAEQQIIYSYLQKHGGGIYFPWLPLSHLLAEGAFYHSAFGITERLITKEPVTRQHFDAYVPSPLLRVAFGHEGTTVFDYDLLSVGGYSYCAGRDPLLPSWQVYDVNNGGVCAPTGTHSNEPSDSPLRR